jgi:sugar phosphate isomerase/epimerase
LTHLATAAAVGVLGHPLPSAPQITVEDLTDLREAGVDTVGIRCTGRERATYREWAPRLREALELAGISCAQLVTEHGLLIATCEETRRQAVDEVASGLPVASALGADALYVAPGGFSDAGHWWYDARNFSRDAFRALERSLRQLAERAERSSVGLALEGAATSAVHDPAILAHVLDIVDSPFLRANVDYVNLITPARAANFHEYLTELEGLFARRVASIHVKDVVILDELPLQMREVPAGEGILDMEAVADFAIRLGAPALVEHLEDRADARAIVSRFAELTRCRISSVHR